MQRISSQYTAALNEPMVERTLVRVGEIFGVALRDLAALWRKHQEHRRDRMPAEFAHMDARMLRDIGAPDWMIDRATVERQQWQTLARYLGSPPTL